MRSSSYGHPQSSVLAEKKTSQVHCSVYEFNSVWHIYPYNSGPFIHSQNEIVDWML